MLPQETTIRPGFTLPPDGGEGLLAKGTFEGQELILSVFTSLFGVEIILKQRTQFQGKLLLPSPSARGARPAHFFQIAPRIEGKAEFLLVQVPRKLGVFLQEFLDGSHGRSRSLRPS